jgi:tripartite-type tricarboxylate transporter receptor subunit TctC
MPKRVLCAAMLVPATFAVWAAASPDSSYPVKPIRVLVGFPAGGSDDYVARVIGPKLAERFGQPVVVDNRPGAATTIAADITARANPDGHTLMLGLSAILASGRSLYPTLGFDLLHDFAYVSRVATAGNVLLAHPSLPAKSVAELVSLAKSQPKAIRYGSAGVASTPHLAMELLQSRTGMKLLHVPYKGGAPAVVALTAGEVQIGFASVAAARAMISAKRLNALAVTSTSRTPALPAVPTVAESGFPGFDVTNTFGILAPAGTPANVVRMLNEALREIVAGPEVRASFAAQGLEATGSTPEEWKAIMEKEVAQWARVIRDAGITVN